MSQTLIHLRAANLSNDAGVTHGFFGRTGGVSEGIYQSLNCGPGSKDAPDAVRENRKRVLHALAAEAHELASLYQVHGATTITVEKVWPEEARPQADAMVTNTPGVALGILTADCAPLLFADPHARVIGAAHAGWKGAFGGVAESVLAAMERLGARRERIAAAIGPCISQAAYEVGPEFRERFLVADSQHARFFVSGHDAHWQFDLPGFLRHRLAAAGLARVEALSCCTYEQPDAFFSYRRTTHRKEPDYGRQLSAIALSR